LEDRDKVEGGYNLTAKTGSIPYMAPEVVFGKPYNQSADVFSFGILLWELLTLQWAFNGYLAQEFFIRVAKNNERLLVPRDAPPMIRAILPEAWDKDPKNRPTMKRMGALIRGELEDITADSSVVNRTQHMMNQSARSQHLRMLNGSGRPNLSMSNSRNGRRDSFIGGESVDNADEGRMR
jgi:serine/threonine protein kinase